MLLVLQILVLSWCLNSVSQAADVIQDPTFILSSTLENISVTCEHDDASKYRKTWYRQEKGKGLVLIGYTDYEEAAVMENEFKDGRIKIQPKSSQESLFTISTVSAQDNAVYYCASSLGVNSGNKQEFGQGTVVSVLEKDDEVIPPKVTIYRPSKQEIEVHRFISLVCVASDFFPEHVKITWLVNGFERINLYEPVPEKKTTDKKTNKVSYSTSKRLTLTKEEYFNPESTFKCVAAFLNGEGTDTAEVKGEADCSISKETYTIHVNQGKISYIMILCKSGLYALVVLALLWRKKVIANSY